MVRTEQRNRRVTNPPKINSRELKKTSSEQMSPESWGNLKEDIFNLIR